MLADFILENRDVIVARTKARVATRTFPKPTEDELTNGIPVFLDQLEDALRTAAASGIIDHQKISETAGRHGRDLLRIGLTIAQVVHDYGDVCQAITELAVDQSAAISTAEFKWLNLYLDEAIAEAVTVFARQREEALAALGTERLGVLAHELRNVLNTATLSFDSIQSGRVAPAGSTGIVHARSLTAMRHIIDRSLADVRLDAGIKAVESISVAEFVEEAEIGALLLAEARDIRFETASVDRTVTIEGDRQILAGLVANLLHNAFKFTHKHGHVLLRVRTTADRVLLEVEDECGGLPPGTVEEMFRPFQQRGADRTGAGLGLAIALKAAKANGGEIRVKDLPGKGCVFTLDLPRKPPPPLTLVVGGQATADGRSA